MANKEYGVKKYYKLGSLDLGSSLVARDANVSPSQSNIVATEGGSITVRPGREIVLSNQQFLGPQQGLLKKNDEVLYADNSALYHIANVGGMNLNVSSGAANSLRFTKEIVSNEWHFRGASITGPATSYIFDLNLGTGFESVANAYTNYSVSQAISAATSGFVSYVRTASDLASWSQSAATFIPKLPYPGVLSAPGLERQIPGFVPESVSWEAGRSNLSMLYSNQTKRWPTIPHTQHGYNGDLYMGVGERLLKYDGYNVTSAGLRKPENVVLSLQAGVGLSGTYMYAMAFARQDPITLAEVESEPFYTSSITTSGTQQIGVYLPTLTAWRPTWEESVTPWGGLAQGAQSVGSTFGTVLLTIDDGYGNPPYLDAGDYPWFEDSTLGFIARRVQAVDGTNVLFESTTALNVADNTLFSPITVKVYRTKVGPSSLLYSQSRTPIDVSTATQAIIDSTTDANLGEEFTIPLAERLPLPDVGAPIDFIGVYRGLLVVGLKGVVAYSDITSPEYFPSEFIFTPTAQDPTDLTGASFRADHFLVFKENSTSIVSGDLITGQYTVDTLSHEVGCCSPFSIQEISDVVAQGEGVTVAEITYWVSRAGVFRQSGSGSPQCISDMPGASIQHLFTPNAQTYFSDFTTRGSQIVWSAVNSYHDTELKVYVIYLPINSLGSTAELIDSYRVFAFDYVRTQWREWHNFNFARGVVQTSGRDIYYGTHQTNALTGAINNLIEKKLRFGSRFDISDNVSPIEWDYKTGFETLGEPSTPSKATRARIENLDPNIREDFSVRFRHNTLLHSATTDAVKSFTASIYSQVAKIKKPFATAHQFEVSGSSLEEQPVVSGIEVEFATTTQPKVGKDL